MPFRVSRIRPWAVLRALRARGESLWLAAKTAPPARPSVGSPLDEIDDEFHDAYERSRLAVAHEDPVFVVLANDLVLFHRARRQLWSFTPRAFHLIKSVSHVPLALFSARQHDDGLGPAEDALGRRQILQTWIADARRQLADEPGGLSPEVHARLSQVLQACGDFLSQDKEHDTREGVEVLARELGPLLIRLIDDATQLQLEALHGHTEAALRLLTPEQVERLQIVVTGNHQARVRSLPMQYFRARMREPEGTEQRVTYAEGVTNERDALALVGTRKLDRAIGKAFFGDETRMQRDLLGDAARARLESAKLPPIEPLHLTASRSRT